MKKPVAIAVAAYLSLQSTLAFGDAIATASFANIKVELIDLAPQDGIEPAVTFNGLSSAMGAMEFIPADQTTVVLNYGDSSFGAISASLPASTTNWASASFNGDPYKGTGLATASARVTGLETPFGARTDATGAAIFGDDAAPTTLGFALSPHTELIISGWADLEGEFTPGGFGKSTSSDIELSLDANTSAGPQHSFATLSASLDAKAPSTSVINEGELSVTVSNGDATPASGFFFGLLSANVVSTVPEPPASMTILAALAAMAVGAQRRRLPRQATPFPQRLAASSGKT